MGTVLHPVGECVLQRTDTGELSINCIARGPSCGSWCKRNKTDAMVTDS